MGDPMVYEGSPFSLGLQRMVIFSYDVIIVKSMILIFIESENELYGQYKSILWLVSANKTFSHQVPG
jgi:hypothetical protein